MPPFPLLSDEEIDGRPGVVIPMDRDELARKYRALRQHHVEETERLLAKDRALLAQMAATLASTRCSCRTSVHIARMILVEVDRK